MAVNPSLRVPLVATLLLLGPESLGGSVSTMSADGSKGTGEGFRLTATGLGVGEATIAVLAEGSKVAGAVVGDVVGGAVKTIGTVGGKVGNSAIGANVGGALVGRLVGPTCCAGRR